MTSFSSKLLYQWRVFISVHWTLSHQHIYSKHLMWGCNEINKQLLVWSGFTVHWQDPWCADWEQLASLSSPNRVLNDECNDWVSALTCEVGESSPFSHGSHISLPHPHASYYEHTHKSCMQACTKSTWQARRVEWVDRDPLSLNEPACAESTICFNDNMCYVVKLVNKQHKV